jgi:radical SAM protein with 4Fe4S-binding SPASM domain
LGSAILTAARGTTLQLLVHELPLVRRLEIESKRNGAPSDRDSAAAMRLELVDSRDMLYVESDGRVFPSPLLPVAAGDVRRQELAAVWRMSPLLERLRDPEQLGGSCGRCEFRECCGGSRVRAWRATGDVSGEDPGCLLADAKPASVRRERCSSPRARTYAEPPRARLQ